MKTLMLLMQVLAILPGIIKAVQQMVPENAGHGNAKLEAAIQMVTRIVGDVSTILPQITALIEVLVSLGKAPRGLVAQDDGTVLN